MSGGERARRRGVFPFAGRGGQTEPTPVAKPGRHASHEVRFGAKDLCPASVQLMGSLREGQARLFGRARCSHPPWASTSVLVWLQSSRSAPLQSSFVFSRRRPFGRRHYLPGFGFLFAGSAATGVSVQGFLPARSHAALLVAAACLLAVVKSPADPDGLSRCRHRRAARLRGFDPRADAFAFPVAPLCGFQWASTCSAWRGPASSVTGPCSPPDEEESCSTRAMAKILRKLRASSRDRAHARHGVAARHARVHSRSMESRETEVHMAQALRVNELLGVVTAPKRARR